VSETILEQKRLLRARIQAWRAALAPERLVEAGRAVAELGLAFLPSRSASAVVSGFSPLPGEFRLWPLLRRLDADNVPLALPVIEGKRQPLRFRTWRPGDATEAGQWGIAEPKADQPSVEPDILLVPLLAFDGAGFRLGYGGGYYDCTLRRLRGLKPIVAVGIACEEQRVERVPHFDYDERLDWVLTPSGPVRCVG